MPAELQNFKHWICISEDSDQRECTLHLHHWQRNGAPATHTVLCNAWDSMRRWIKIFVPGTIQRLVLSFFLIYINPHHPITSWRVAHWIKDVLREAGVNTNTFKAHSVQGASTTASLMKGISFRTFSVQRIGALNPHFRDFIIDLKRRMSMLAPYWNWRTRKVVSPMGHVYP